MRTIVVGIPVLKDTRRFHFEKGRRWTVFEHIVLEALAKRDWTISDLQQASTLPRRVLIEILIRLMRMGWIELFPSGGAILFRSTALGRVNATKEELPPVTKSAARFLGFAVDQITGAIFRGRDLTTTTQSQWNDRTRGRAAILIKPLLDSPDAFQADVRGLADTLLEADEELTRVDVTDAKPRRRIALAAVRGTDVEGLGPNVPQRLREAILDVARGFGSEAQRASVPISVDAPVIEQNRVRHPRQISFAAGDLILDGEGHRNTLRTIFEKARSRVVLHSTFINMAHARENFSAMRTCAERGAKIDILWGQSDDKNEVNQTRAAAAELRKLLQQEGIEDRIRVHQTSTRSHAKLVLHDIGDDRFVALVGSCNWLSAGFNSFDATVRLRDPTIVADVAFELAELARPRDGQIPELSSELVRLGYRLEQQRSPISRGKSNAQLVLGPEHVEPLHMARDESLREILVMSHRLGVAAKPVLKALSAAVNARRIVPTVYYGRVSGPVKRADAREEIARSRDEGISLEPIHKPRIHAKVLCWDDDNIVVTSLNWLSADASSNNLRQEIGVHINSPSIAKLFRERLQAARDLEV